MLSNQFSAQNPLQAQWSFEVNNRETAGKLTYRLNSYILFQSKKISTAPAGTPFALQMEVQYVGQFQFLWWFDGWEFTDSINAKYKFI